MEFSNWPVGSIVKWDSVGDTWNGKRAKVISAAPNTCSYTVEVLDVPNGEMAIRNFPKGTILKNQSGNYLKLVSLPYLTEKEIIGSYSID